MRYVSTLLGIALFAASAGIASAWSASASARDQLRDLRGEARQVRSAALYIDRLSTQPGTTWDQMDKQWNMIKPQQEAMRDHVSSLEAMDKSLTPAEQKAIKIAKVNVEAITAHTHEIRMLLDQNRVNLQGAKLRTTAIEMAREASAVAHGAEPVVAETATHKTS